ncbi:MAG: hypothetical protein RL491_191, partial [Bacteroidota bacterium]
EILIPEPNEGSSYIIRRVPEISRSSGIYFYKAISKDNKLATGKLTVVKNR